MAEEAFLGMFLIASPKG